MNKEKVVCAAIRYTLKKPNAKKIFEKIFERVHMCVYYDDDFIKEALRDIKRNGLIRYREERGFISNQGRFLLPIEALELSGLGNQLRFKNRKYLLPEDLY